MRLRGKGPRIQGSRPLLSRPGARVAGVVLAIAVCALVYSLGAVPAHADDTSVGGIGGDLYPLESTAIRMEAETVQAVLFRRYAEFRVDFKFVNSGSPQKLLLGFPYRLLGPEDNGTPPLAFQAWQDGKPLSVRLGKGHYQGEERGYFLHEATFPSGETMITVSYLAEPTWSSGDRFPELVPPEMRLEGVSFLAGRYDYWLHTGASWAGTIGRALVRFTLADECDAWGLDIKSDHPLVQQGWPWTTKPETYVNPDPRTFVWDFRDLEPTQVDDIVLAFTGPFPNDPGSMSLPPVFGAVLTPIPGSYVETGGDTSMPWAAVDGSAYSAWSPTSGPGESRLRLAITGNKDIGEFRILTGLNRTLSSFYENGRPKTVKVTLSDGHAATFTLLDEPTVQRFPLQGRADWVQVEILDTYPGTKSDKVYISEVSLGARPAPTFAPFAELLATGGLQTTTTSGASSSTSSTDTGPPSTSTSSGPSATTPPGGLAASDGWPLWPTVAFGVAGAAFLALIALLVVAVQRR